MPRRKEKSTFQSYVQGDEDSVTSMDLTDMKVADMMDFPAVNLQPSLLPGEIIVSQASSVLKFMAYSDRKQGVSGCLVCTNFKITFVTAQGQLDESLFHQRNKLIGEHDIALTNIAEIFQVSKSKRKHLTPGCDISGKIKILEVHCKNFRIHNFSFKFADPVEAKTMVHAIVHHSFPTRLELLFAFEYKGVTEVQNEQMSTPRYHKPSDWEQELQRLNVQGFKASQCNPKFRMSESMPECVVVPGSLTNSELGQAVPQFVSYRAPTWSYTHANGASLLRMSHLMSETTQTQWEHKMQEAIRLAHPRRQRPRVYDLMLVMPSFKEIQASYEHLRELCMPITNKDFWEVDSFWFSALDNTSWLQIVSKCLTVALRISDILMQYKESVVLKEMEGRDMTALVSCLTQILLDPHCRTIYGFQCLVEREFVSLGHRFTTRCGLLLGSGTEQSPILLLFLDCVWQLTQQFPSAFEFSATFLANIWDSVCLGMFDNFIFNSDRERMLSMHGSGAYIGRGTTAKAGHKLMSVWDWSHQFDQDDLSLHRNPLYLTRTRLELNLGEGSNGIQVNGAAGNDVASVRHQPPTRRQARAMRDHFNRDYSRKLISFYDSAPKEDMQILRPVVSSPLIQLWESLYLRWVTPIQIIGGGSPLEYLHQCILVEEIICVQNKIDSLQNKTPSNKDRRKSDLIFSFKTPSSALPDRNYARLLTSSFPFSPGGTPRTHVSFCGTPIGLFVENSLLLDADSDGDLGDSLCET